MADLSRRRFLAVGGSVMSALALPAYAHAAPKRNKPLRGDWNPTALWQPEDLWGAHA